MCLVTVYYVLEHWNYPLKNILGELGCHISNLLRQTGSLQIQFHSFIMATTRYIFLFHDNLLLRFNLTTNVSAITYSLHCTKQRPCKFILIFRRTIVRQCYGNLNFYTSFNQSQDSWPVKNQSCDVFDWKKCKRSTFSSRRCIPVCLKAGKNLNDP